MVLLSLESENGSVLTYRLAKNPITVGSSSRNDVVVRSPGVAERHLVIQRNGDMYTFVTSDRQSAVLNGERRSRGVLSAGDKIRIGGITLVFRGVEAGGTTTEERPPTRTTTPAAGSARAPSDAVLFRPDPSGFAEGRTQLAELLHSSTGAVLKKALNLLCEMVPGLELAVLAPISGGEVLASVWTGDIPTVTGLLLEEFKAPGRYGQIPGEVGTIGLPIHTAERELAAVMFARPSGMLGHEGLGLLFEAGRLLGLFWNDSGRREVSPASWEPEARQRLDALLPGTSQAMQILRAGVLAAAHGIEPALICGTEGSGRTELARILSTVGAVAGRPFQVVEGRPGESDSLRRELYGVSGHPTFGPDAAGAVGHARGGYLVIRNVDRIGVSLQDELAALIAAQGREPTSNSSIRWVVTCGEDPLALVQQGKLSVALFMVFGQRMLRVPRLAERREDLALLIAAMIRRVAVEQHKTVRGITLECLNMLLAQTYPGEIAELVATINRLVTATPDGDMVRAEHLTADAPAFAAGHPVLAETEYGEILASDSLKDVIPRVEQLLIDRVMRRVKGNQSKGARTLGISRGALIAKLKEYDVPDYRFLKRQR